MFFIQKLKCSTGLKFDEWKLSTSYPLWNVSYMWKLFQTVAKGQKRFFLIFLFVCFKYKLWLNHTLFKPNWLKVFVMATTKVVPKFAYLSNISLNFNPALRKHNENTYFLRPSNLPNKITFVFKANAMQLPYSLTYNFLWEFFFWNH